MVKTGDGNLGEKLKANDRAVSFLCFGDNNQGSAVKCRPR